MFTESAEFYDLLYRFKDYQKEAGDLIQRIKRIRPGAKTVLDIGCGTAEHHKYLQDEFQIDGLDLHEGFIEIAKRKNPSGHYYIENMINFKLGKKYEVILCLFSSIAYVKTYKKLKSALTCFYQHLEEDGLVFVEPWLTPDHWQDGKIHMLTYEGEHLKICRMNRSASKGRLSLLNFHYLVGTPEKGVRHIKEKHELALFTQDEMNKAFHESGFEVSYDEEGITGRGLYFGRKKAAK
ncbi:MAG TPA: methyltransferase domain-containing protein [Saprospiraceae bacterium]|nr:methyltransferase domain-containing protein [Saprospiraceae bacterium]HNT19776.1 methyltransferase domain-containing protein [Saprospiraceae bacterium]